MCQWFSAYLKWCYILITTPLSEICSLEASFLIREKNHRHLSWPHKHYLSWRKRSSCATLMPNVVMSASLYIFLCSRMKVQEITRFDIPIYCKQAATAVGTCSTRGLIQWSVKTTFFNNTTIFNADIRVFLTEQIQSYQTDCCLTPEASAE